MPRHKRCMTGGLVYHVLNRANAKAALFGTHDDYGAFERVLAEAHQRVAMRTLAYCIMPNHWHLVLWPRGDEDLPRFMHWLTLTHTRRWHGFRQHIGMGHVYQGRYKSFPVEASDHLLAVCRYVERNPLSAGLVRQPEQWRWCSLWRRQNPEVDADVAFPLSAWPVARPADWVKHVNEPLSESALASLRPSLSRGRPYGTPPWTLRTAKHLGLESTLRPRGRPPKDR